MTAQLDTLPSAAAPAGPKRGMNHARYFRHEAQILRHCRNLMKLGDFRPTAIAVATAAGCSVRTVFQHYPTIGSLWLAALNDDDTRDALLQRILGPDYSLIGAPEEWFERIARAAVTGTA
jgi:hypothetical protein